MIVGLCAKRPSLSNSEKVFPVLVCAMVLVYHIGFGASDPAIRLNDLCWLLWCPTYAGASFPRDPRGSNAVVHLSDSLRSDVKGRNAFHRNSRGHGMRCFVQGDNASRMLESAGLRGQSTIKLAIDADIAKDRRMRLLAGLDSADSQTPCRCFLRQTNYELSSKHVSRVFCDLMIRVFLANVLRVEPEVTNVGRSC